MPLMRKAYEGYRKKVTKENDTIIAIIDKGQATKADFILALKKLLKLEGEFKEKYNQWSSSSVNLNAIYFKKEID